MTVATAPRCEARIGYRPGELGEVPVTCGQSVALKAIVAPDGTTHHACSRWGHVAQVAAKVARMAGRCECHSHLEPDGSCSNADCHNWGGPR